MKTAVKILWRAFFAVLALFILIILFANWGFLGKMPSIEELQNPSASLASQVYADDGGFQYLQATYAAAVAGHPSRLIQSCRANAPR